MSGIKADSFDSRKNISGIRDNIFNYQHYMSGIRHGMSKSRNNTSGIKGDIFRNRNDMSGVRDEISHCRNDYSVIGIGRMSCKNNVSGIDAGDSFDAHKMRGVRQRSLPPNGRFTAPASPAAAVGRLASQRWRDLILRFWHGDPLRCLVCQNPMRVIAVIDDPRGGEKTLRHLGARRDPPARLPPQGLPDPYTREPCNDVNPMPDYENVLTI